MMMMTWVSNSSICIYIFLLFFFSVKSKHLGHRDDGALLHISDVVGRRVHEEWESARAERNTLTWICCWRRLILCCCCRSCCCCLAICSETQVTDRKTKVIPGGLCCRAVETHLGVSEVLLKLTGNLSFSVCWAARTNLKRQ